MFKAKTVLSIIAAVLQATMGRPIQNRFAKVFRVELHRRLHLFINRSR